VCVRGVVGCLSVCDRSVWQQAVTESVCFCLWFCVPCGLFSFRFQNDSVSIEHVDSESAFTGGSFHSITFEWRR
jgi:hypothetical protein